MSDEFSEGLHNLKLLEGIITKDAARTETGLPIVDLEFMTSFTGSPNEPYVWLIVNTEAERTAVWKRREEIQQQVRRLLVTGGYPPIAATTALVTVASREQIKAHGGPQHFFR